MKKSKKIKVTFLFGLLFCSTAIGVSANRYPYRNYVRNMQQNAYTSGYYKQDESKQYVELSVDSMGFDEITAWVAYTADHAQAGFDYSLVVGTTQRIAPYYGDRLSSYFSYCCGMQNANWSLNTTYVEGWYDIH